MRIGGGRVEKAPLDKTPEEAAGPLIMGLESVSASEDVIGDLPSPWATINS